MAELTQLKQLPKFVLRELRTVHTIISAEETQLACHYLDNGDIQEWLTHFDRATEAFQTVRFIDSLLS
jgi:hypothetical protein